MTTLGHILIIDDDRDFAAIYREMLESQGHQVELTYSAEEAARLLETSGLRVDVVLLDQKLQGPGGPDSGLDLIQQIETLAPFAKTIVVTGYAAPAAIEQAFRSGVYDYLVKNGAFSALLHAKVRNALEITSERRLAALSSEQTIGTLRATWGLVQTETDRNRKGALLEELVKLLFRATPGFERVETRLDNEIEEIDIVVENRSEDAPWKHEAASYLLGECKNWSKPCGSGEFRNFNAKLMTKFGRATIGFFFAPGGFTEAFHEARAAHKTDSVLVIPVDAEDLTRWIESDDRLGVLGDLHKRAVFDKAR